MPNPVQPPTGAVPIEKTGHTTYHLTPLEQWEAQDANDTYLPDRFADEGFIHCTDTIEEIIAVGNRYYQNDPRPYRLLEIDCDAVTAPIVYEDQAHIFPHIYGPLDVAAVRQVHTVNRDSQGAFVSIQAV